MFRSGFGFRVSGLWLDVWVRSSLLTYLLWCLTITFFECVVIFDTLPASFVSLLACLLVGVCFHCLSHFVPV